MNLEAFHNRKIAVLGFGQEGQAVLKFFHKNDLPVTIFDRLPFDQWDHKNKALVSETNTKVITGPDYLDNLAGFDFAFRSPGIWRLTPKLLEAEQAGLNITSQTKLFFEHCPAYIVGITGTKGKGTTSSLIARILNDAITQKQFAVQTKISEQSKVFLTGNIGLEQPLEFLEFLTPEDFVVFEMSSFQLQDLTQSPQSAVVLMITQDHLDNHQTLNEYHDAKSNIVRYQTTDDYAVINIDYPASQALIELTKAQVAEISAQHEIEKGAYISENQVFLRGWGNEHSAFLDLNEVLLRGKHNLQNISAATLAALQLGVPPESISRTVRNFEGLEHRLELVGEFSNIKFYNDSFATVPETSVAALDAFSEPLIVILGGSEKNSDFTQLGKAICSKPNLKGVILIGQTAPKIMQAIKVSGTFSGQIRQGAQDMSEIFEQIKELAEPGDVVLLSPGCASFGMFENYKQRGKEFKEFAKKFREEL